MKPPHGEPPKHWASLEERGVYLGLRIMLAAYRVLGRAGFSVLLAPVIFYFFLFSGEASRASRSFLTRAYKTAAGREALGRAPGWRDSFWHFYAFGQAILDKIAAWRGDIDPSDVEFENDEIFERLLDEGRGALLVASHLGNMEVCRALGQKHRHIRMNVLVHTKHSENFNRLISKADPGSRVSLFQTTEVGPGTAMRLQEAIDKGEIVVIVGDRTPQDASGRYGWAPFLGKDAPFPQGPYILASLFQCPVQLIFCIKKGRKHRVIIEPFAERIELPRANREKVLQSHIEAFARRLEFHAVRAPFQWFNFFDFWNQAPRAGNSGSFSKSVDR